jgi:hypothetical protein
MLMFYILRKKNNLKQFVYFLEDKFQISERYIKGH